jgi:hypothetical protein
MPNFGNYLIPNDFSSWCLTVKTGDLPNAHAYIEIYREWQHLLLVIGYLLLGKGKASRS